MRTLLSRQLCGQSPPEQVNVQSAEPEQAWLQLPPLQVALHSACPLQDCSQPPCGHSKSHVPLLHEQSSSAQMPLLLQAAKNVNIASERLRRIVMRRA